jgi:hypothetical protein
MAVVFGVSEEPATKENPMATTIADIARQIADQHNLGHDEALTLATTYAIQCDVDCGVQEGGQAPGVEVADDVAEHILAAAASA